MRGYPVLLLALGLTACFDSGTITNVEVDEALPLLAHPDDGERAWRRAFHEDRIVRQRRTYVVGDTEASHRTIEQLTGLSRPKDGKRAAPLRTVPKTELPQRWDWREHGVGLPPIRNQGSCGSCWAFGTTAVLESAIAIFGGQIVDLSEQSLVDCNGHGYSCGGGYWVYDYFVDPGAIPESEYPYTAQNGWCSGGSKSHPHVIQSYHSLPAYDVDAIKAAIYEYGAVGVTVAVCGSFPGYSGGIYDSTECNYTYTNHIVALVGWDDTVEHALGRGVWIMRNSWGTSWGEGGYMRMAYGTAKIEEDPTYAIYADPVDSDGDGVSDGIDNCPDDANPGQQDADLDGVGDACDPSFDPADRALPLGDDDTSRVSLGFAFPFFGAVYTDVWVNSDGNLTFGAGDAEAGDRSRERLLTGAPRIAVLFADLDPSSGGAVTYRKDADDTIRITYDGVPGYGVGGSNTASVVLDATGMVRIEAAGSQTEGVLVGVSRGGAGNTAPEVDLSAAAGATLGYQGQGAVFEEFAAGETFDLGGVALVFADQADDNQPPTVSVNATPRSGDAPLEVTFTSQASDPDGAIASYAWDFDDGGQSTAASPVRTFATPGSYLVSLTVRDDRGATATTSITIEVTEAPAPPDDDPPDDDPPPPDDDPPPDDQDTDPDPPDDDPPPPDDDPPPGDDDDEPAQPDDPDAPQGVGGLTGTGLACSFTGAGSAGGQRGAALLFALVVGWLAAGRRRRRA